MFVGSVVFVGSFYFRWVVGLLGCCVCWLCCVSWVLLLPLGCWVVGLFCLLGLLFLLDLFYFRWAVGLLGCWVVGLLGLLCLLDPVVFVGSF